MDLLMILRVLVRHPRSLLAGLAAAIAVAVLAAGHVSSSRASITSARLLVGPPNATASTLDSITPATLMMKAPLLADVLATDPLRTAIARQTGVPPGRLTVMGPAFGTPTVGVPLALRTSAAATRAGTPWLLLAAADERLPVIVLRAAGPSTAGATRLIDAATRTLQDYVGRRNTALVVQPLGPVTTTTTVRGHPHVIAIAAGLAVFVFWCCGIVVLAALARAFAGYTRSATTSS